MVALPLVVRVASFNVVWRLGPVCNFAPLRLFGCESIACDSVEVPGEEQCEHRAAIVRTQSPRLVVFSSRTARLVGRGTKRLDEQVDGGPWRRRICTSRTCYIRAPVDVQYRHTRVTTPVTYAGYASRDSERPSKGTELCGLSLGAPEACSRWRSSSTSTASPHGSPSNHSIGATTRHHTHHQSITRRRPEIFT
mgnify:CR=1 FL=1